jgi:hypothetical protein
MIDYFLKSSAHNIKLEILDSQQKVVHTFSSDEQPPEKSQPLPVAERWLPKPETLEKTPGLHRFLWDLTWRSSGGPSADDNSAFQNPRGPEGVPGLYEIRLTVDGGTQAQPLKVVMDPRSSATPEILQQQMQLAQQIFDETVDARKTLAEMVSAQTKVADVLQRLDEKNSALKSSLQDAQAQIARIVGKSESYPEEIPGLQDAYSNLASALRVVEGGNRPIPSQVLTLYQESSRRVKKGIAEWKQLKEVNLPKLNQKLRKEGLAAIPAPTD